MIEIEVEAPPTTREVWLEREVHFLTALLNRERREHGRTQQMLSGVTQQALEDTEQLAAENDRLRRRLREIRNLLDDSAYVKKRARK